MPECYRDEGYQKQSRFRSRSSEGFGGLIKVFKIIPHLPGASAIDPLLCLGCATFLLETLRVFGPF